MTAENESKTMRKSLFYRKIEQDRTTQTHVKKKYLTPFLQCSKMQKSDCVRNLTEV